MEVGRVVTEPVTAVRRWMDSYAQAWKRADVDGVGDLFTADATYTSHPFRPPHVGVDGIRAYWRGATADQSDVEMEWGEPLVEGERAAVERWTRMTAGTGGPATVVGVLLGRFEGYRCACLREHWHVSSGRVSPYEGWGVVRAGSGAATRSAATRWAEGYEAAWRASDAVSAAGLYAEEAVFRSHPLRAPHVGRPAVNEYCEWAFASESEQDPGFGAPVASGACAAVEYWAPMLEEGKRIVLAGCSFLTLDEMGRVAESREYWNAEEGIHRPPPEWGWR
jgi:ketosteroid isomerase-like protein